MPKDNRLIQFFKRIKENFGMLLLLSTIVTFHIIIGANEKGLRVLPISILLAFIIFYLIILKIKNKDKSIFFKSKIDYFVLAFMLTTTLPLIFKTYASYSDTFEFMMKYFFIYTIYVLARNVIKDQKDIEWVIVTTIIGSFFSVIFFYDYFNTQYLKKFMKWIDITYNKNTMFFGTFGYANAEAIYLTLCIFFAMHRFKFNKNKFLKVLDVAYIIFALYLVWATEARAVILLIAFAWFAIVVVKFKKQILKHKVKILILIFISLILLIMFLSMALKVSAPIVKKDEDLKREIKYNFKKNQKYTIELELETVYNGEFEESNDSNFTIKINEVRGCFFGKELFNQPFGEFDGKYKIDIIPTKDIDSVRLRIENTKKGIIKLNNCYINGEKIIINYKYIPRDLGFILSGYTISGKSLPQRIQMYKDCIKMIKDSWVVGHGGNTWKNLSLAYSEYKGALKESHSYFFELLISYGIIGCITFYAFIIYFFGKSFKQCIKNKEKTEEKLFILIGLFLLSIHSLIDFDMSFMLIQLMVYISVAILLRDEQEEKNNSDLYMKYIEYTIIGFCIIILSLYIRADISKYLLKDKAQKHYCSPYNKKYYNEMINDDIKNKKDDIEILNKLKNYMKKEPYFTQNENYERYFNIIGQNVDNLSNEELEEYLNFGIEKVKNTKVKKIMYFDFVKRRTEILVNSVRNFERYSQRTGIDNSKKEILNNAINELKSIIKDEYHINIENLENLESNGYTDNVRDDYKKKYQEIVKDIKYE